MFFGFFLAFITIFVYSRASFGVRLVITVTRESALSLVFLYNVLSGGRRISGPRQLRYKQESNATRINRNIRVKEVRLIDPKGNQVGIVPIHQALAQASYFALDLVEISPNANPPVCKIMDYGRFRYEQSKKTQEAKKKQASFQLKEIKVRPKTGENDLKTKIGHIRKFIARKDKVKVTVIFRGREITLSQLGRGMLKDIADATSDIAIVEQMPKFEGRTMVMVLSPR